ncbi:MAG: DUF192 domain-containing protein [Nitrospirales bacterium]|nr:DUF192 domain-containing protein [Nitrospira sp.]MDR4500405.1 DUF192 domain-containing protein [Nitrospirales bacterium]
MPKITRTGTRGIVLLLMLFVTVSSLSASEIEQQPTNNRDFAEIISPNQSVLTVEIADTPAKRSQGLMFRTNMPPDHGMLFVFRELDHWTFWMKNTKIPLDIIWLDQNGHVVHIESNVPVCTRMDEGCPRYHTLKEALYVLELNAGMAKHYGISIASQLTIKLPPTIRNTPF